MLSPQSATVNRYTCPRQCSSNSHIQSKAPAGTVQAVQYTHVSPVHWRLQGGTSRHSPVSGCVRNRRRKKEQKNNACMHTCTHARKHARTDTQTHTGTTRKGEEEGRMIFSTSFLCTSLLQLAALCDVVMTCTATFPF